MALYNVQKRQTLDRLTLKYQLETRAVLRRETQGLVRDFHQSLDAGRRTFEPHLPGLEGRLETIFNSHMEKVIHVAVSDGIQEVTPGKDYQLGLWQAFPATIWIEDTLSVRLASERDKIAKAIRDKDAAKKAGKSKTLAGDLLDKYLENLKKTYRALAKDWLAGEDTASEVIKAMTVSLKRSDSAAQGIFRTETTNYFNETRHDYFATNTSVDYIELYAVTDGRISKICEDRHQAVVTISEARLREYMPAFHPNCRTIQRPLISALSSHKKIIEAGLALRATYESSWTPIAWDAHAA